MSISDDREMRFRARQVVISRAVAYVASDLYFQVEDRMPGANDADEMDYKSDSLDNAVLALAKLLEKK